MMYVQIKVTDQIERRVCPALSWAQESFERDSCTRYLKYARKFRPHDSRVVPCAWACPYDITTSNKDEKDAEISFEILLCYFQEKMKKGFNIPFKPYFVVLDKSAKNGWNLKVILNFFVVPDGTSASGVFKNAHDTEMSRKSRILVTPNNNVIFLSPDAKISAVKSKRNLNNCCKLAKFERYLLNWLQTWYHSRGDMRFFVP